MAANPISDSVMTRRPFLCTSRNGGLAAERQQRRADYRADLWTMFLTDFAHSVVEGGSRAWELPVVTSITQLCGLSSSWRGREPSSRS